jgi:hypothetical protein
MVIAGMISGCEIEKKRIYGVDERIERWGGIKLYLFDNAGNLYLFFSPDSDPIYIKKKSVNGYVGASSLLTKGAGSYFSLWISIYDTKLESPKEYTIGVNSGIVDNNYGGFCEGRITITERGTDYIKGDFRGTHCTTVTIKLNSNKDSTVIEKRNAYGNFKFYIQE